jgi:hypothetical protein
MKQSTEERGRAMGKLTIQNLDDALLVQLKRRAWEQGLPLNEMLRRLLESVAEADRNSSPRVIVFSRTPWIRGGERTDELDRPRRGNEPSACGLVAG